MTQVRKPEGLTPDEPVRIRWWNPENVGETVEGQVENPCHLIRRGFDAWGKPQMMQTFTIIEENGQITHILYTQIGEAAERKNVVAGEWVQVCVDNARPYTGRDGQERIATDLMLQVWR